jgi:hypothetical protein
MNMLSSLSVVARRSSARHSTRREAQSIAFNPRSGAQRRDMRDWDDGHRGRAGSRIPQLVAALIIREAIPHRLLGRKTLCVSLAEIIAALGTGFSVIFPSLMIGIDQSIVSERRKTFGESIDGVLLCGSEHFESPYLSGILLEVDNVAEASRF